MSQSFAPWVDGSNALDLSAPRHSKSVPHLRVVPSAPECEESDYEDVEKVLPQQSSVEGVLVFAIKSFLVLAFLCCLVLAGLGIGFALKGDTDKVIAVQAGDSLYSIGASLPNAPSPQQAAEDIRSINALDSDVLHAGQKLILPEY